MCVKSKERNISGMNRVQGYAHVDNRTINNLFVTNSL